MTDKMLREERMVFGSAITTEPHLDKAMAALISQIEAQMAETPINFAQLFMTPHFRAMASDVSQQLHTALNPEVFIGCTGESVISREREVEQKPGIALITATLPNVTVTPFKLQSMDWDRLLTEADAFQQMIASPEDTRLMVILADPFTTPIDRVLQAFNTFYPGLPLVGGMASGSHRPGGNALLFNDEVLNNGAVGVAFGGAVEVDVVVSQGCRPIGQPLTVTEAKDNVIVTLGGDIPLAYLQNLVNQLSSIDQALLQHGLFIGRVTDGSQPDFGRGDFLVRGVMGIDQDTGSIVVGDYIEAGETVQFHVRDAFTAEEDLEMMLTPQMLYDPPAGAFLFSCNGRGIRLYDHPDGDISIIQKVVGDVDLAGFFCAGEIGPIGGKNFLHGHTASMALFRPLHQGVESE